LKWFVPHPRGNVIGVLFDEYAETQRALFLTPEQARFEASFTMIREAERSANVPFGIGESSEAYTVR
jgi:hypothetical protein